MSNVMIASGSGHFAAVKFEFGKPAEEFVSILGDHDRYLDLDWDRGTDYQGMDKIDAFIGSNLGNRAGIWVQSPDLFVGLRQEFGVFGRDVPWNRRQENCVRTILWVGHHSCVPMDLPEISQKGLDPDIAVHRAVQQVMLAQGAFWSLTKAYMGRKVK